MSEIGQRRALTEEGGDCWLEGLSLAITLSKSVNQPHDPISTRNHAPPSPPTHHTGPINVQRLLNESFQEKQTYLN